MAFNGYYLKIGDCTFQDPAIKREGFTVNPRIVQVTDNKVLASGKLSIKKLSHQPTIIIIDFPPMTPSQWANYCQYFRGIRTSEDEMALTVEYYDEERDGYFTATCYHTDLEYTELGYFKGGGVRLIQPKTLSLKEL